MVGPRPPGQNGTGRHADVQAWRPLVPPVTERNPLHRQFLYPHTLKDLARDPPGRGLRPAS